MTALLLAAIWLPACSSSQQAHRPEATGTDSPLPTTSPPPSDAPLPNPANGTDISACASGNCEVRIDGPTDITVDGIDLSVTPGSSDVTFTLTTSGAVASMATPVGNSYTVNDPAGKTVTATVEGVQNGSAVLKFSSS